MQEYELIVVLNPTLTQDDTKKTWGRITGLVSARGGDITHEDWWGTRHMAYSIRSQGKTFTEGTYVMGRFKLAPSQAREVETNLRLTEDILRFLMVKADTPLKPPAPKAEAAAQQTASEAMPATEPAPETVPPQSAVEGESTPG